MAPKKRPSSPSTTVVDPTLLIRSKTLLEGRLSIAQNSDINRNPRPDDFISFFPWACSQLGSGLMVKVVREFQAEYVSVEQYIKLSKKQTKGRSRQTSTATLADSSMTSKKASEQTRLSLLSEVLLIKAIYSSDENNLIQIKILNQNHVPRSVFIILGLIIKFHPFLAAITINRSQNQFVIYEISKLLCISNITDICFDGSTVPQSNYHILLDEPNKLKHLSLARCNIDDSIVKLIASKLHFMKPASKNLVILNLSSNFITDVGAFSLAEALRSNRKLSYLNLSGNMLTDTGASYVLDYLVEFLMTYEEDDAAKARRMVYLRQKETAITRITAELKAAAECHKPKIKPKSPKSPKKIKSHSDHKGLAMKPIVEVSPNDKAALYQKAKDIATENMGQFEDPFDKVNTVTDIDGEKYCLGNNTLCYLNLSYNNLTRRTLLKLITVLEIQKINNRTPRGLMNIQLEGNPFPAECWELAEITNLIESSLVSLDKKHSVATFKKRSASQSRRSIPSALSQSNKP